MALIKCRSFMAIAALVAFLAGSGIHDVAAQSSSDCSSPALELTPCLNIITGSNNGVPTGNPSKECCDAMRTVANSGVGCFCLLITTSNPLGLINRTLALGIPGLCKIKTQPLDQCEANAGVPFTAPTASPGSIPAPTPSEDLAHSSPSAYSPATSSASKISPSTDLSPTSLPIQPGSSDNLSPTSLPTRPASGVDVNGAYRNGRVYLPAIVGTFGGLTLASILF